MKKVLMSVVVAALSMGAALAKGNDDPVLMTVNKKPVTLSEFEYLYNKNNAQQRATQPVDEYLDLFVIYKLKVADAEANGLDQSESFQNEFAGYRRDLAEPYLIDTEARDSLARLIYDRMGEEVLVSHIMVEHGNTPAEQKANREKLQQARRDLLAGKVTFEQMADSISIDPSVSRNHGSQGYISGGMFPANFEDAAFLTPVGEMSDVIETSFGWHLVKIYDRRPSRGQVKVKHILRLTQGIPADEQAAVEAKIDSIYNAAVNGADFSQLATDFSEDPGSARSGGELDWFGAGQMVPEFEATAFELANGEISKPFKTSYGWHIILKEDSRGLEPYDQLAPRIIQFIGRNERQAIVDASRMRKLRAKYHTTINDSLLDQVKSEIAAAGSLDSAMVARYSADNRTLITLNGNNGSATVADLFNSLAPNFGPIDAASAAELIDTNANDLANNLSIEAERNNLANDNADYRNLLNEYRDGILLFEISDRNVWSKSKNDQEGLNAYFEANKNKYATWTEPHFKGYMVFATSDSIADLAKAYLAENPVEKTELSAEMRRQFGKEIRVERVLARKGQNPIIDFIAFGAEKPEPKGKWIAYFPYAEEIIDQPQEPADMRGEVTTDYQNDLEQQWIKQLRKKYPVKINKKVLKQVKQPTPIAAE